MAISVDVDVFHTHTQGEGDHGRYVVFIIGVYHSLLALGTCTPKFTILSLVPAKNKFIL